jgi:DNA adenine methylase
MEPLIKWVGGKSSILSLLKTYLPIKFDSYFEPFVGGGALFWNIDSDQKFINDQNSELINFYQVVRDQPDVLLEHLKQHQFTSDYYYTLREWDRLPDWELKTPVEKASRFLYLNKTGYNGLYRVNSKNQNNVPWGKRTKLNLVDIPNLLRCSDHLKNVTITNGDFEDIKSHITSQSFIYFDPPYVPLNTTSNFTGYTSTGFGWSEQVRLKVFCDYLTNVGAKVMISNSSNPSVFDLYSGYKIEEIDVARALNCKADRRGKIKEVLIKNY